MQFDIQFLKENLSTHMIKYKNMFHLKFDFTKRKFLKFILCLEFKCFYFS